MTPLQDFVIKALRLAEQQIRDNHSGEIFRQSYPVAKMFICGGCRRGRR